LLIGFVQAAGITPAARYSYLAKDPVTMAQRHRTGSSGFVITQFQQFYFDTTKQPMLKSAELL